MSAREFIGCVRNGQLDRDAWLPLLATVKAMEGKWLCISVRERKRRRSNKQNRYYFGCILPLVTDFFRDYGNDVTEEEVHEYLKEHVGRLVKVMVEPSGLRRSVVRSSASLDTGEWEDYMQRIRAWAAGFGLELPLPNEQLNQGESECQDQ